MSFGNNSGGNGFGGFPPQQQPPSGWGFPQQAMPPSQPQPMPFGGGYRTPAAPDGAKVDETWFEVTVPFAGAPVPNACACCCGPSEVPRVVSATVTVGRTHYTRRMNVPYCRACEAAAKAGKRRGVVHGLVALAVAGAFPLLLSLAWLYAPAVVTFVATPLVALGALFALAKLWKDEPIARHRGATSGARDAVWMLPFVAGQNATRLAGTNERWMQQLGAMHHSPVAPRGRRPDRAARFVAVPLLAALLAVPVWFGLHGHVYFDNPTASPLTFDIDDGLATVTVPPNGHDDLYLPQGHTVINVLFNGQRSDRIAGDIDPFGKHVASPYGQTCYATITHAYGSASVNGPSEQIAPQGQRWFTLDGVQLVFEPFPHSVSVSNGQTGATRKRFARVHCATGAALD